MASVFIFTETFISTAAATSCILDYVLTSDSMSLHSRFKFWALLPIVLLVPITGLLTMVTIGLLNKPEISSIGVYVFPAFFIFIWVWLVFGELRTKVVKIEIDNGQITVSNFLGFGIQKHYVLSEFDGFETALLPSKSGIYEYLYLMSSDKKIIKLSQFYHSNYADLKSDLMNKIKNLGQKKFSYLQEIKEIFI